MESPDTSQKFKMFFKKNSLSHIKLYGSPDWPWLPLFLKILSSRDLDVIHKHRGYPTGLYEEVTA